MNPPPRRSHRSRNVSHSSPSSVASASLARSSERASRRLQSKLFTGSGSTNSSGSSHTLTSSTGAHTTRSSPSSSTPATSPSTQTAQSKRSHSADLDPAATNSTNNPRTRQRQSTMRERHSKSTSISSSAGTAKRESKYDSHNQKSVKGEEVEDEEMNDAADDESEDTADDDGEITRCICGQQDYPGLPSVYRALLPAGATLRGSKASKLQSDEMAAVFSDTGSDEYGSLFIQCDICKVWQHGGCVGIMNEASCPDEYFCEKCRTELHHIVVGPTGRKITAYVPIVRSLSIPGSPESNTTRQSTTRDTRRLPNGTPLGTRRRTMNSRAAYDEEEQLRRAIEASKEETRALVAAVAAGNEEPVSRRGKRAQPNERKPPAKRQRTMSPSPTVSSRHNSAKDNHLDIDDRDGHTPDDETDTKQEQNENENGEDELTSANVRSSKSSAGANAPAGGETRPDRNTDKASETASTGSKRSRLRGSEDHSPKEASANASKSAVKFVPISAPGSVRTSSPENANDGDNEDLHVTTTKESGVSNHSTKSDGITSNTSNDSHSKRSNERFDISTGDREPSNHPIDRDEHNEPSSRQHKTPEGGEDAAPFESTTAPAMVTEEPQQLPQRERGKSVTSNPVNTATSTAASNIPLSRANSEVNISASTSTKEVTTESTTPIASRVSKTRSSRQNPTRHNTNTHNHNNNNQSISNGTPTIHEMRRRVSLMLEHISRLQLEMAMTETPALASAVRPTTSATAETTHSTKTSPSKSQRHMRTLLSTGSTFIEQKTATGSGKGANETAELTSNEPRTPAKGSVNAIMSDGSSSPLSSPAASPMGSFSILDGPIMETRPHSQSDEQEKWEKEVREQKEKGISYLSSVEMMDVLTRNLLRWQQEFGKTDK